MTFPGVLLLWCFLSSCYVIFRVWQLGNRMDKYLLERGWDECEACERHYEN